MHAVQAWPVTAREYDAREIEGIKRLSPEIVSAFRPVEFIRSGFPVSIGQQSELARFADHLVESATPLYFTKGSADHRCGWRDGFTRTEYDLLQPIRAKVCEAVGVRPMLMPMIHIAPARVIDRLGKGLAVLELGPGTGYLGPLLTGLGHHYASMDITQAYVLWQCLLHEVCGMGRRAIWWWDYAGGTSLRPYDVIYSNANLAEMTPCALDLVLQRSSEQLAGSAVGAFVYFHVGSTVSNSERSVDDAFVRHGFTRVQAKPYHLWRRGKPIVCPPIDPIGPGPADITSRDMAWINPGEEPAGYNARFMFGDAPPR